jgi:hypothetical protein
MQQRRQPPGRRRPSADRARRDEGDDDPARGQALRLALDPFAREALERIAAEQKVSVEEVARFALMYYIADVDSGRIARRAPPPSVGRPTAG